MVSNADAARERFKMTTYEQNPVGQPEREAQEKVFISFALKTRVCTQSFEVKGGLSLASSPSLFAATHIFRVLKISDKTSEPKTRLNAKRKLSVCAWVDASFCTPNVTQPEKPNTTENLSLHTILFIAANNYKWTWHPCEGTPALERKYGSFQNNGGVKRVRPREGLGACFSLSSLLQASLHSPPRPCSPLQFGSVFLNAQVLEAANTFGVPVSKSAGVTDKDA
ncbi:Hypothetical predicted protein [Xyrichtys novacula]|uniref:Uncharacterized protein n=1 Tax=Xyrichtys novacula TaxID=13765 RepID=A0AAV1ES09_XYRNO|nr:Hypothetical predicted protein [Xyrichtys novacula]